MFCVFVLFSVCFTRNSYFLELFLCKFFEAWIKCVPPEKIDIRFCHLWITSLNSQLEVFSDLPGTLIMDHKPVWELVCSNKFSRDVPFHSFYSLPKFEPIHWWVAYFEGLFLCWVCRESQLYVSGDVEPTPVKHPNCVDSGFVLCPVLSGNMQIYTCVTWFSESLQTKASFSSLGFYFPVVFGFWLFFTFLQAYWCI